ncbi:MAG: hypothetical protein IM613_02595 [Cytophagales bacterium]|nr:hypothetical protein [Cytophagales bacterium]MCA6387602.1 hypothetical protein [Cytophagales bacterium]MCA6390278.1 hypothetical protein [Cytophagales bacterium]MCA6399387.1 hypothetical protein [Cytophagales bacterium]MCA6400665.1 hypothetical protein [Cytophagales bacterium]
MNNSILVPGKTSEAQLSTLTIQETTQSVTYLTGSGRVEQSVITKGSPLQKDIVSFQSYDAFGREATKYLPYISTESNGAFKPALPSTEYYNFYNNATSKVPVDASPFSKTIFNLDPLSRVFHQGSVGTAWQPTTGAFKSVTYGTNEADEVKKWNILDLGNSKFSLYYSNFYDANELSVITNTDEHGLLTKQYKDYEGKTICTRTYNAGWVETAYLYDDRGDLRFVVPPEAISKVEQKVIAFGGSLNSSWLATTNLNLTSLIGPYRTYLYLEGVTVTLQSSFWPDLRVAPFPQSVTSDLVSQYAYQYLYDNLHRKIAEKVPGTDWKYFVYDNRDQLVLSQDGNQRLTNQYSFTKYDDLGRPVLSGLTTIAGTIDQVRANVDTQTVLNEQIGTAVLGYTNNAYPNVSDPNAYLVATYYDNYSNCPFSTDSNFSFVPTETWVSASNEPFQKFDRVVGRTIGSSVKILGTNNWLNTISYYNRQGAVIQTIGSNHLNGRDRVSTLYDFSGKKLEELHMLINYNSGGIGTQRKRFDYDHAGRLLKVYHQLNTQGEIVLSSLEYNELGQVVKKKLHSEDTGITYLQALDYRYNIRGWMTNLNTTTPELGDPQQDYFGMDLSYNNAIANAGSTTRTDGLVSAIKWKNDLSSKQRLYNFGYDNLKQLSSATHKMSATGGASWGSENDFYNETGLSYDLNGNIKSLSRNTGFFNGTSNTAEPIDQLTYNYGAGGNQLQFVKENIASANKDLGFKDGGSNTANDPDYTYDANGNVTKDQNKSITSITYYFNNLPKRVTFSDGSYLENTYDAAGIKLIQIYFKAGTTTTTDYVGGMVFLNGQVLLLNHEEGRITAPTYSNLIVNKEASSLDGFTAASASVSLNTVSSSGQNYVVATTTSTSGALGVYPIKTTQGDTYPVRAGDTYTLSVLGYQTAVGNMTWANVTNAILDDGVAIYPSPTTTTWGSGASSVEKLPAGASGWVEFKAFLQEQAIGLSENDVNANWQSVQYGFFVTGSGASFKYSIIESGNTLTAGATLTTTDVLRVERIGAVIYYKKNGTVVYTSSTPSTTALLVDITLNKSAYLLIPKISFAKPATGLEASLYLNSNVGTPNELANVVNEKLPNQYTNEAFSTFSFTIPTGMTSITVGVRWYNGASVGSTAYINRVALYKTNFEYNYFLDDQVGSTRVVLQTAPATITYTATMETENQTDETQKFQKVTASYLVVSPGNTTPGGNEVIKLNNLNKIGPGKSLKVYPGDKINASAWSYYVNQGGFNKTAVGTMAGLLAPVFGGVAGVPGDPGAIFSNVGQAYGTGSGFGLSPNNGANFPSAFLNYILFDKDYKPLDGKSVAISTIANAPQPLALPEITALELGYVFIYLSYDNDTGGDVFFDDLKITVKESPVIQVNNYYPFGMQSYTWIREGETDNAYLFQGKELIAQTGWHDFGSRMYYGDLGRWFATDPQKQFSSPYTAMGNIPNMSVDPNGEFAFIPFLIQAYQIYTYASTVYNVVDGFARGGTAGGMQALAGATFDFTLGKISGGIGGNISSTAGLVSKSTSDIIGRNLIQSAVNVGTTAAVTSLMGGDVGEAVRSSAISSAISASLSSAAQIYAWSVPQTGDAIMLDEVTITAKASDGEVIPGSGRLVVPYWWGHDSYLNPIANAVRAGQAAWAPFAMTIATAPLSLMSFGGVGGYSSAFIRGGNAAKGGGSLWPAASGGRTVINGIEYTTHALERMQPVGTIMKGATSYSRGIPPSVVKNAIKFGKVTPGNTAAEVVRTFDNVRVITNPAGTRVISVFKIGS